MKFFSRPKGHMIAVDFGSSSLKVAEVERKGGALWLMAWGIKGLPFQQPKKPEIQDLVATLKTLLTTMGLRGGLSAAVINTPNTFLRLIDLPWMPSDDVVQNVTTNSLRYLHQDCTQHTLDCHVLPFRVNAAAETGQEPSQTLTRLQVLVGGALIEEVRFYKQVMNLAGLRPHSIGPSAVAMLNAFETGYPEIFAKETVALVDAAHTCSQMIILHLGTPVLTRTLQFGGQRFLEVLKRTLENDATKVELEKTEMTPPVSKALEPALAEFAKEIRTSLDSLEQLRQIQVSHIFLSGGFACQSNVLQNLQENTGLPCTAWNPAKGLQIKSGGDRQVGLESQAPLFVPAIGAALAYL